MIHHDNDAAADATLVERPITESGERVDQTQPDPGPRLRAMSVDDLTTSFDACDLRETGLEPDWAEHLAIAERSRSQSIERT